VARSIVTSGRARGWSGVGRIVLAPFLRFRESSVAVVVVLLGFYFWTANNAFFTSENIATISQLTAPTAIIAYGETMLLICGEIDLSVGQVFALAPFVMDFVAQGGVPLPVSVVLALIASTAVGFLNGLFTVFLRVPSFVATLGMLFLLNGVTLTISHGFPVNTPGGAIFTAVMGHAGFAEIVWALGLLGLMHLVLTHTRFGLHTIATGGNLVGASEAGVRVGAVKMANFMLTSLFGGFSGILEAVRIRSTDPLAGGTEAMFAAVVGAVIGGTALAGGSGTIIGAMLGTLLVSVLKDGFTLLGVSAFTFDMILGVAILVAMVLNVRLSTLRRGGQV
jgi:simple sugar transport system permease protein